MSVVTGDPESERGPMLSKPDDQYFTTMAVAPSGVLYLAYDCAIRRVGPDGLVQDFVGGTCGYSDGSGSAARFNRIYGVASDGDGNLFVSDTGNAVIRKVSPSGDVTTVSGVAGQATVVDGPAHSVRWMAPRELALDRGGNVFVVDSLGADPGLGRQVRKLLTSGEVKPVAGGLLGAYSNPGRMAVDSVGSLYLTVKTGRMVACIDRCFGLRDSSSVLKIDTAGKASTLAGSTTTGTMGAVDGPANGARFNYAEGIVVDSIGNVYVSDVLNEAIRKIGPDGTVSTVIGVLPENAPNPGLSNDDPYVIGGKVATGALPGRLRLPDALAMGPDNSLYISVGRRRYRHVQLSDGAGFAVLRAELTDTVAEAARKHLVVLQAIADANGGHRAAGSAGFDASAFYAERLLRNLGFTVNRQNFDFDGFFWVAPGRLEQVAPAASGSIANIIALYSGSGSVTAAVAQPSSATGCTATAFDGFPMGSIALIRRGDCTFPVKARNAYLAGASGVVIYNNVAGDLRINLLEDFTPNIPVVSTSQEDGERLARTAGLRMRLEAQTVRGNIRTSNVIAEFAGSTPGRVVMLGGHLDSVNAGPGINDNGSGVAALLEAAAHVAKSRPYNTVRIALWGAEELGDLGSQFYVGTLSPAQKEALALYLNFDMIGSPNAGFFVYDGDGSGGGVAGPSGSGEIESVLGDYYRRHGVQPRGVDLKLSTDHLSFVSAGIPVGGIFSGHDGIKTAEQAALWGGTSGAAYDPCYHRVCDVLANADNSAFRFNVPAVLAASWHFAMRPDLSLASAQTPAAHTASAARRSPPVLVREKHGLAEGTSVQ
ncbi:M28 family peptidase [Zoogloea sp.]|uniref:M28 family peptidase n=1 Tax=Zoogloea sp. TaxID=49181 RepID=UPI0035B36783